MDIISGAKFVKIIIHIKKQKKPQNNIYISGKNTINYIKTFKEIKIIYYIYIYQRFLKCPQKR
jgi:hypothetical protein